jgi:hypothetical protein
MHPRWSPHWTRICHHLAIQRYYIFFSSSLLTQYLESNVCWVTQLVVSSEHRERVIATTLLHLLPGPDVKCAAFGLASSHPAACAALSKRARMSSSHLHFLDLQLILAKFYPALDANLRKLDLDFIKAHAQMIIDTSPVSYLKNAQLHGSLFQDGIVGGAVCSVNTEFFVDHDEPLQTLKRWEERQDTVWPLGELAEGHEFLCIVPSK